MIKKVSLLILTLTALTFAQAEVAPKFEIKDINSKATTIIAKKNGLDIPSAKGKIVFIEFWGTHCPPCVYSIPHYIELTKKYKDKLVMFAVESQGSSKEALAAYGKSKGINYNLYTQRENIDFVKYLAQRAGWRGSIPFLVILDTTGDVVDIKTGMVSSEYLEGVVNYILKKQAKATVIQDNNTTKESNNTKENNSTK
jgi:thiol-disulfide isomerase/thioredoxin